MSLEMESPAQLIPETIKNFNIATDLDCLSRIAESISFLNQARQIRLSSQLQIQQNISRKLEATRRRRADEIDAFDNMAHVTLCEELESTKFRVVSHASKLESEAARLEAEAKSLDARVRGIREGAVARGAEQMDDQIILKLGVYRNMGIDAERDEETGTHTRAIVRNAHTKDVHVFDVDGSAHETDQVWKSLPG